jgi:hypothetical protein
MVLVVRQAQSVSENWGTPAMVAAPQYGEAESELYL